MNKSPARGRLRYLSAQLRPEASASSVPFLPEPLRAGGIVLPLWLPGSPQLNAARAHEPECYNHRNGLSSDEVAAGKRAPYDGTEIRTVVNVHNPSIEA